MADDHQDERRMREATRKIAERDKAAGRREAAGSHDFGGSAPGRDTPMHEQGTSQTNDIHDQAPASAMARQKANPAVRRKGR